MYCILYCTLMYFNVLYCTVLYCTVLYCTVDTLLATQCVEQIRIILAYLTP